MASSLAHMLSSTLFILSGCLIYLNVTVPLVACNEFVSSFFESHQDHALLGHVIDVCTGNNLVCGLQCLRNDKCRSYNCFAEENQSTEICHLNNETRTSRPEDFMGNQGTTYFELMQIANSKFVCENDGRWSTHQNHCKCSPGYKGITCSFKKLGFFSLFPGHSCKDIRDSGDSEGDREYWIDPAKDGNPLKVYCDMTTDGGGWLVVASLLMNGSTPLSSWTPLEMSYRGISNYHNDRMGIITSAMKELRAHLNFTQIRFHCSKQQRRTLHVTTVANTTGEAVVRYFSGQTDVLPSSCNSYQRLEGDNSELAMQCDQWGNDGSHYVGKWGHYNIPREHRMYNHAAFIAHKNHWVVVAYLTRQMASNMEHKLLSSILLLLFDGLINLKVNVCFAESSSSVSSFFESHEDYALLGHVIEVCTRNDLVCGLQCLRIDKCRSYNCFAAENSNTEFCHLNNETRFSKLEDFKKNQGSTYFELTQITNSNLVCENDGRWSSHQNNCTPSKDPECDPGHTGNTCSSEKSVYSLFSRLSCKDIRDSGDSKVDGEYWIDPAKDGNPLKVYCDMTTDEGGWLLVANFVMESSAPPSNNWEPEPSYRGISNYHNNRMAIGLSGTKELSTYLNFTQLRFHCSKQQGRTFHVTTVANSTGEAVVQYFSDHTDVLPLACNSFNRLDDDNSQLAMQCHRWSSQNVGKWGSSGSTGERIMYNRAAFIPGKNQWNIVKGKWLCDDKNDTISAGDFWKVYVR